MLSNDEKEMMAKLMSKMSEGDGDHDWLATSTVLAFSGSGRSAFMATAMADVLTEEEQIAALDALPAPVQDAAVIRWGG